MTNKDFAGLGKQLLPNLTGFSVKGPMTFVCPVKNALRGLCFEGSSFDRESFYVWTFFLPLFVPTRHVSFNFGKRLREPGGGDRWNADTSNLITDLAAAVKREALPFLSGIESAEDIAKAAAATFQKAADPYAQETIAYAWARSGEVARANEELNRLVRLLDLKIPWQREMAERAETLKVKLTNPTDAQHQLEAWETETLQNLGLEEFQQSSPTP
jgi:hypothetical protein